jgi:quercetin dioxygenase-like cupin family protein
MKVFEAEPNQKKTKKITPAIGSQTWPEVQHDLEAALVVFKPGQKTHLHFHESDQILYIIAGKGVVGTEKEQHLATPGKVFVTPKGQKHFQAATEDSSFTFLYVLKHPNDTKVYDFYVPIKIK